MYPSYPIVLIIPLETRSHGSNSWYSQLTQIYIYFWGNPSVTSCYMLMFPISKSSFIKLKHTTFGPKKLMHNCSHLTYNHNLQTIGWQILDRSLTYFQTSLIVRECPSPFDIPYILHHFLTTIPMILFMGIVQRLLGFGDATKGK